MIMLDLVREHFRDAMRPTKLARGYFRFENKDKVLGSSPFLILPGTDLLYLTDYTTFDGGVENYEFYKGCTEIYFIGYQYERKPLLFLDKLFVQFVHYADSIRSTFDYEYSEYKEMHIHRVTFNPKTPLDVKGYIVTLAVVLDYYAGDHWTTFANGMDKIRKVLKKYKRFD